MARGCRLHHARRSARVRGARSTLPAGSAILRVYPRHNARNTMAAAKKQTAKKKTASKKTAAKKTVAKKTVAKKAAAKRPAAKNTGSEKGVFCKHGNIASACLRCK
jgi:hypothetical protein